MDTSFASRPDPLPLTHGLRLLERLPLLQDLGNEAIGRLAGKAVDVTLPAESVIFRQGEMPVALYFVVHGQAKLSLHTERGDDKVFDLIGPSGSFGAVPVFLGVAHTLTAQTIAETRLVQIEKNAVLAELERNPDFSYRMLREVSRRLLQRTRDFENCMLLNGAQRVTNFLLSQLPDDITGGSAAVMLPAKKGIIASRLNLTHEHFSRILHEMQSAGLIEVRGREIRMIDVSRLRACPRRGQHHINHGNRRRDR